MLFYYKVVALKRLMPILLSVALVCCSNLFAAASPKHYSVTPMRPLEFYMNKLGKPQ